MGVPVDASQGASCPTIVLVELFPDDKHSPCQPARRTGRALQKWPLSTVWWRGQWRQTERCTGRRTRSWRCRRSGATPCGRTRRCGAKWQNPLEGHRVDVRTSPMTTSRGEAQVQRNRTGLDVNNNNNKTFFTEAKGSKKKTSLKRGRQRIGGQE